jgi:hypothetical protein
MAFGTECEAPSVVSSLKPSDNDLLAGGIECGRIGGGNGEARDASAVGKLLARLAPHHIREIAVAVLGKPRMELESVECFKPQHACVVDLGIALDRGLAAGPSGSYERGDIECQSCLATVSIHGKREHSSTLFSDPESAFRGRAVEWLNRQSHWVAEFQVREQRLSDPRSGRLGGAL